MSEAKELSPGIYDLSMPEYLRLKLLSSSLCNLLLEKSPYHARYAMDHRDEDDSNDASNTGTAIHDALLEGVDRIVAVDAENWRTKAAREARDAAQAAGKIPLLAHAVEFIHEAVDAAKAYIERSQIAGVFETGNPEQTLIFEHDGVKGKCRPDWLTGEMCLHVKTTKGTAQPDAWIRGMLTNMGYDIATAFYGLATDTEQIFLVIEQARPFGCSLIGLSPAMADIARSKVARAIAIWRECEKSGKWPCYPTQVCYAEPTGWQLSQAEEQQALSEQELSEGISL